MVFEKFSADSKDEWEVEELFDYLRDYYLYEVEDKNRYLATTKEDYAEELYQALLERYKQREEEITPDFMRKLEKYILFEVVDSKWREHLKSLDSLRSAIYLRSYGQRDPVVEYKILSGELFEDMIAKIQEQVTSYLFKVVVKTEEDENLTKHEENLEELNYSSPEDNLQESCPCGSGKTYEKCCGR